VLDHEFIRHALLAGSLVAVGSGLAGWFVVLRAQVFAVDALSHVAFPGALVAAAAGIDLRIGVLAASLGVALVMARLGSTSAERDLAIGATFAWVLGVGALLLAVLAGGPAGGGSTVGVRALFGSIFGLSTAQAGLVAGVSLGCAIAIVVMARPLLLASVNPVVARVRGVRVAALELGFLAVLAVEVAQASQAVGALLLLGLVAAPAGAAHRLTRRPFAGMAIAAAAALLSVWVGVGLSYRIAELPPSAAVVLVAGALYALAHLVSPIRSRWGRRPAAPWT
jgi:zinc/manganese transport system permease protein